MLPGLSHSSLAYWSSCSATAVNGSQMCRWLCSLLSVAWHRHRRFAPSRTRRSPKAAVAYVCGEVANVESLARQACEFSVVDIDPSSRIFNSFDIISVFRKIKYIINKYSIGRCLQDGAFDLVGQSVQKSRRTGTKSYQAWNFARR